MVLRSERRDAISKKRASSPGDFLGFDVGEVLLVAGGCMKSSVDPAIIAEIWSVIQERAKNPSQESYTSRLLADPKGIDKVLEKVGEESTEFIIAAKNGVKERTVEEASDLLFHLLVALRAADIDLSDVMQELKRRRK